MVPVQLAAPESPPFCRLVGRGTLIGLRGAEGRERGRVRRLADHVRATWAFQESPPRKVGNQHRRADPQGRVKWIRRGKYEGEEEFKNF